MKTHGEVWYEIKQQFNSFDVKFDDVNKPMPIPERISRAEATKYYNAKCRRVFEKLGLRFKDTNSKIFQTRVNIAVKEAQKQTKRMLRRERFKIRRELEAA